MSRGISAVSNSFWVVDGSTHLGQEQASRRKIGFFVRKGRFGSLGMAKRRSMRACRARKSRLGATFGGRGVATASSATACSSLTKALHDGTKLLQRDLRAYSCGRRSSGGVDNWVELRIAASGLLRSGEGVFPQLGSDPQIGTVAEWSELGN